VTRPAGHPVARQDDAVRVRQDGRGAVGAVIDTLRGAAAAAARLAIEPLRPAFEPLAPRVLACSAPAPSTARSVSDVSGNTRTLVEQLHR
jgi:hypothetical protein